MSIEHGLAIIEPWAASYGAFALFVVIYFESFGVPLPGESALIAASALALRGDLPVIAVLAAGWCGAVLGDSTGYFIGRIGGRRLLLRYGPHVGMTAHRFELVADKVRRNGFVVVLTARFVVILRQINGLVAGTVLMPLRLFIPANAIGAALWVLVWGLGPYLFGAAFGLSPPHAQ
jgi:membrane protein DedA with SNARE-associated domain